MFSGSWFIKLFAFVGILILWLSVTPSSAQPQEQDGGGEIVGGTVAGPNEFRFVVALLNSSDSNNFNAQFCGGSLIGPRRVLTAAHCVTDAGTTNVVDPDTIDVLVGTNRLDSGGQRIRVSRIHVHPSWNPSSFANDLAALDLSGSVNGPTIRPVLPAQSALDGVGRTTVVAGWGRIHPTSSVFPVDQRKAVQIVEGRSVCESAYPGPTFRFTNSVNVCAGQPAVGSCNGDSGGPLFTGQPGSWIQVGIVSFGRTNCGTAPGVYTRVRAFSLPNDRFTQARPIPAAGGRVTGRTFTAAREAGEPNHAANNPGGASAWWTWRPTVTRMVTISTAGSSYDTLLGVYRGTRVNALNRVASNDDAPGTLTSRVTFRAQAGVTYRIAVDGFNGGFGNVTLRVT